MADWQKLRRAPAEYREIVETIPSAVSPSIRFFPQRAEGSVTVSIVGWVLGVIFLVPATLIGIVSVIMNHGAATDPIWLQIVALGIPAGLSAFVLGGLHEAIEMRRRLRDGEDPDGIYFVPRAIVQRMNGQMRVFEASRIERFTYASWIEPRRNRRPARKVEETRIHMEIDGDEVLHAIGAETITARELLHACRAWHREVSD